MEKKVRRLTRSESMKLTVMQKFKYYINPSENCWEWMGGRNLYGYGVMSSRSKQFFIHRLSYQYFIGELNKGDFVCHKCDNPPCCNPFHLFVGTCKDNAIDMVKKGRNKPYIGEKHHQAKIKESDVIEIRSINLSAIKIGNIYGISESQVLRIRNRESWKHLK